MYAHDFIYTAGKKTKFNICIENDWHDGIDKNEALELVNATNEKDGYSHSIFHWFISAIDGAIVISL